MHSGRNFWKTTGPRRNLAVANRVMSTIFGGMSGHVPIACTPNIFSLLEYAGTKVAGLRALAVQKIIQKHAGELQNNTRLRVAQAPSGSRAEPYALVAINTCQAATPSAAILFKQHGVDLEQLRSTLAAHMPTRRESLSNAMFAALFFMDSACCQIHEVKEAPHGGPRLRSGH